MTGTDNFAHRAGYATDAFGFTMRQARKGGTLMAGEGALLVAEIDRLQAAVERVRALHFVDPNRSDKKTGICYTCDLVMPCPTLRALGGDDE